MLELKYLWSIVNLEKAKRLSEASDRTVMSLYEGRKTKMKVGCQSYGKFDINNRICVP